MKAGDLHELLLLLVRYARLDSLQQGVGLQGGGGGGETGHEITTQQLGLKPLPPVRKFSVQAPTFLTLAEKSVTIFSMLLVSAKSLQMKASSAQITRMDRPGPGGRGGIEGGATGRMGGFRIPS